MMLYIISEFESFHFHVSPEDTAKQVLIFDCSYCTVRETVSNFSSILIRNLYYRINIQIAYFDSFRAKIFDKNIKYFIRNSSFRL